MEKPHQGTTSKPAHSESGWPRALIVVALLLVIIEGAIRKWLIGSEAGYWSYLAYFSKDLAFASILLWPPQRFRMPALSAFTPYLVFGGGLFAAGAVLSWMRGSNAVGALLTLRAGLLLPVIAGLAIARIAGVRLERVAALVALLAVINCGLGWVQARLPQDHILNRYVLSDSPVIAVESAVRATGTFSYITGIAIMSSVGIWAGMVLLALSQTTSGQILAVLGIVSGFGCALTSLSRGPLVIGCVMLAVWICGSRPAREALARCWLIGAAALVLVSAAGVAPQVKGLARAMISRHESGDDTFGQRAFGQLAEGWEAAALAPFGAGLGTEQIGGNYASTGTMSFTTYETQFPRVITETGVLGLVGFLVICLGALVGLQQAKKVAPSVSESAAIFATQLLLIPLFYGNVLFNHTSSAFVWMIFATVLANREKCELINQMEA